MQTFRHRGLQIAYDETGRPNRPPLVLIHGWLSKRAELRVHCAAPIGS